MILLTLISASVLTVILFYVFAKWYSGYWKKQGIPYEEGEFFYGNFKEAFFGREHFGLVYKKYYDKYVHSAPFVGLFKLRQPMLLINDLDVMKSVLVSNFASFCDTELQADPKTDPIWAGNPIAVKGNEWKISRSRWVTYLSPSKIKQSYETSVQFSNLLVEYIKKEHRIDSRRPLELLDMVSIFFLDYLISGVFGVHNNSLEDRKNTFYEVRSTLTQASFINGFMSTLFVIVPSLQNFLPFRFVSKENEVKLLEVSKEIMKCRKETGKPDSEIYDMMKRHCQTDGKPDFDEWDLAGRIFGVILDGSETASHPACFGLYEVACNQDIQTRLREELMEAYSKNNGELSYDELLKLPYLEMVSAETLRLYSAVTHLTRVVTKEITLKSHNVSVDMKKGVPVIIPTYAVHHDPQFYPDPDKFNPERFTPEAREHIPKFAYMPFGEGPRICAGLRVGTLEIKVLISAMVRNFKMRPESDLPRPLEFVPNFFVARSNDKLAVYFEPIDVK